MTQTIKMLALFGGDWVLYLLGFLSVWCLGVILERYWVFRSLMGVPGEVVERLLAQGKLREARRALGGSRSGVAEVLRACLDRADLDRGSLREVLESVRLEVRSRLEKNLLILGTLGSNAPFLGLFGTVLGIIRAFNDMAVQGTAGSSAVLQGISEALVATALGLLVAIPAVVAYNYFQGRVKRFLLDSERLGRLVLAHAPSRRK